jgi:hypothetical protein
LTTREENVAQYIVAIQKVRQFDAAQSAYRAIKGDIVDEMLANYVN